MIDFFSSGMAPLSTTPAGATPAMSWTSLRPRAEIYAPGCSDVLPVYRFMTGDIGTVATQLGFIASSARFDYGLKFSRLTANI
jgi:hypothetical protein